MVAARLFRLAGVDRYTLLVTVVVPAGDGLVRARFRSHRRRLTFEEGGHMTGELRSVGGHASGAPADLSALEPGTHLIALYRGDAELARVAGVFVRITGELDMANRKGSSGPSVPGWRP